MDATAPKALFPTYIPSAGDNVPAFLGVFPFNADTIIFPKGEEKLQIEPECGVVFDAVWKDSVITELNRS